ncbi:hypothetical protein N9O61_06555 [Octadecabacter sp.]|nr:hypothetical protein [Octadecabacter sp.]
MKYVYLSVGGAALSACMSPVAVPEGTIPFSQVLAETSDRPYECFNYDANTNTCTGYATHEAQGDGRYVARSVARLSADVPVVQATYLVVERGQTVCSVLSTMVLQFNGDAGLDAELGLAAFESEIREREETCYVYSRTAVGFRSQVVSGSDAALENPISEYHYFNSPKPLRVRE